MVYADSNYEQLALAGGVFAAPMQDVSVTSVDLSEEAADAKGNEHLYVTVTRTDDLVDDDGSLLAERVMAVRVTFDVVENQVNLSPSHCFLHFYLMEFYC